MILIRIILFCLIALFFYAVIRAFRGKSGEDRLEQKEAGTMVPCAYCALHIPEDKAVSDGSNFFCSEEHRKAAAEE